MDIGLWTLDLGKVTGPMATVARRFLIRGGVQGVGYRFFAQRAAAKHQVVGYVRNEPDGSVEVLAEGPASNVEAFKNELAGWSAVGQSRASRRNKSGSEWNVYVV